MLLKAYLARKRLAKAAATEFSICKLKNKNMHPTSLNIFSTVIYCARLITIILFAAVMPGLLGISKPTSAMPMFARKYGVSCATCHTSPPKLNETGYRFRTAGFRWPGESDSSQDKKFNPLDYSSIRLQLRYDASRSEIGSTVSDSYRFRVQAIEAYPMTGAWGKHFSTNFKLTYLSGDGLQLENAYVRYSRSKGKTTYTARAGIFHPYDGLDATDSPATISRPLIQTQTANFDQNTFFRTWGFDQLGAEVGFDHRRTSVRASLFNGVELHRKNGALRAYSAQGGPLTREAALPTNSTPDFQFFVNQKITRKGGNVALHYYQGNIALPTTTLPSGYFRNSFRRIAAYGSYPLAKRLNVAGGFQHGQDERVNNTKFNSQGLFVEASTPFNKLSEAGVRYDMFDPARGKARNETNGLTTYVNLWFKEQFRVVAEYQHRYTTRGTAPSQTNNAFQMRLIFIK